MKYAGINLPENIIIVENKEGQGYVVPEGNDLDAARYWAESKDWKPKEYKYKNGTFTLRITNAAGGSSQGGKLSFWNCQIRTEDEKEFLIGISSDCLAELIINNTLVNGKCQNKIYFAKYKGNQTYAVTENMPLYGVAMQDKKLKEAKTTSKYKPGDLVESLTSTYLYLGEVYNYVTVYRGGWPWRNSIRINGTNYDRLVVINDTPKKCHWLVSNYSWFKDFNNNVPPFCTSELLRSKPSRRVLTESLASQEYLDSVLDNSLAQIPEWRVSQRITLFRYLNEHTAIYSRSKNLSIPNKEDICQLCDTYYSKVNRSHICVAYEHELSGELKDRIATKELVEEDY